MDWSPLDGTWIDSHWTEVDPIGLDWIDLELIESKWIELDWIESEWIGLSEFQPVSESRPVPGRTVPGVVYIDFPGSESDSSIFLAACPRTNLHLETESSCIRNRHLPWAWLKTVSLLSQVQPQVV